MSSPSARRERCEPPELVNVNCLFVSPHPPQQRRSCPRHCCMALEDKSTLPAAPWPPPIEGKYCAAAETSGIIDAMDVRKTFRKVLLQVYSGANVLYIERWSDEFKRRRLHVHNADPKAKVESASSPHKPPFHLALGANKSISAVMFFTDCVYSVCETKQKYMQQ